MDKVLHGQAACVLPRGNLLHGHLLKGISDSLRMAEKWREKERERGRARRETLSGLASKAC